MAIALRDATRLALRSVFAVLVINERQAANVSLLYKRDQGISTYIDHSAPQQRPRAADIFARIRF
ncbi:hypothetical protein PUN4_10086 [Paraburkholderia unamae]|uniref:hypothetical protein n=1 Tax=Paraburkholderia unamae TaxID=219649 RepID=UPI001CAFAF82|nr:hypothetical protein [Paraburkholderia unamae]CAG9243414.1 hypothetical protein PUN4_10086 [Paraburkholderia unamae]